MNFCATFIQEDGFSIQVRAAVLAMVLILTAGLALADSPALERAFEPGGFFRPYPGRPGRYRSFESFTRGYHIRPTESRRTIVLVPIGELPSELELEPLVGFLEAFFQVPARVSEGRETGPSGLIGKWSADAIQRSLRADLPPDALSVLGLTMVDLYAEDSDPRRQLFGQGHYYNRTAVASLNRLHTRHSELLYHRAFKLAAHELTHTFGLRHCTRYRCLMNSSGSVAQSDARPLELCPECLRRLHHLIGFDPVERCQDLNEATRIALPEDSEWFRARHGFLIAP